jgi:hypothetical protein
VWSVFQFQQEQNTGILLLVMFELPNHFEWILELFEMFAVGVCALQLSFFNNSRFFSFRSVTAKRHGALTRG